MEKFFTKKDFADAETVLAQLSVKTNCFNKQGKVIPAEYLVCVDVFVVFGLVNLFRKKYEEVTTK